MLKKFLIYPAAGLLTLTYLLSYIGFGIHTCSCSGDCQIILLFNNLSCEKIHAHIHILGTHEHHPGDGCCESAQECAHEHQDGCCHTDIMVLTDAQDDSRQTGFLMTAAVTVLSDWGALRPAERLADSWPESVPDLPDCPRDVLSLISVRRI